MRAAVLLLVGLALPGCTTALRSLVAAGASDGYVGSPLARATNGAVASFALTACAPTGNRAMGINDMILQLNQSGIVAVADGQGTTTRVVLNLCGGGPVAEPPAPPARAR